MRITCAFCLVLLMPILNSCNNTDAELLSKWLLIEQLADPGDGSGVFVPVSSQKYLEFYDDGTISSNGSICTMSTEVGNASTGTYDDTTMIIEVENCTVGHFPRTYEMSADTLIINYPCIEPCREKFLRTE